MALSMGLTKVERDRRERERREAEWFAEQERVRRLGDLFSAVPDGPEIRALQSAMTDRAIELLNERRTSEADVIIEFLPNDYARKFLDWYFDEDENAPFPTEAPPSEHESSLGRKVQSEPQVEERPDGKCRAEDLSN